MHFRTTHSTINYFISFLFMWLTLKNCFTRSAIVSLFLPSLSMFPFSVENVYFLSMLPEPYFSEAKTNSSAIMPRCTGTIYCPYKTSETFLWQLPLTAFESVYPDYPVYPRFQVSFSICIYSLTDHILSLMCQRICVLWELLVIV